MFPYYILYGMSYEEYWLASPQLAIAYREAYRLRRKAENEKMWVMGNYIFDAFSVGLSNFHLDGKHHSFNEYLKEPYDILGEKTKEANSETERQKAIDGFQKMLLASKGTKNG